MICSGQNMCAIVIVHGQSEYALINSIKSKLRVNLAVFARKKGKESIQITGLTNILNNSIFKSKNALLNKYPNINQSKKKFNDFKIFTVMDVDDCCDTSVKNNYCNGYLSGVSSHELRSYFYPIYNDGNLENVLEDIEFPFVAKTNRDKKRYVTVFNNGAQTANENNIRDLCNRLNKSKKTNLDMLIEYMLQHKFEF
ncbi:hypothetical protein ACEN4E_10545 [Latilactobacillus sakei]|uniref:hypothetical protein n=1 Tax=Latilactobacillus sakei TaxID=1599 RepID=UPI00388A0BA7